jgi:ribosomal protein L40E
LHRTGENGVLIEVHVEIMPLDPKFHLPQPPPQHRPSEKKPCRRCGALFLADAEICRVCGKWRHSTGLIVSGVIAVIVSMLAAWFVFANTF